MKINFTKKEYKLLIDMLSIADWVMNAHHVGENEENNDHKVLHQKILSHYNEMQAEDLIEHAEKEYFQTDEYEEIVHKKYIEPYDDHVFWDELTSRLAERDLVKKIGIDNLKQMEGMERVIRLGRIEEQYNEEFENNGLQNVTISNHHIEIEEISFSDEMTPVS